MLRYIVIDGMAAIPAIVATDLAAGDRPAIARTAKGVFTLTFPYDVRFFNGDVQRGGMNHDATPMLFTSVFATNNLRVLRVFTYGITAGSPTKTFPEDGRMSIVIWR
jgi:hypothetical protein